MLKKFWLVDQCYDLNVPEFERLGVCFVADTDRMKVRGDSGNWAISGVKEIVSENKEVSVDSGQISLMTEEFIACVPLDSKGERRLLAEDDSFGNYYDFKELPESMSPIVNLYVLMGMIGIANEMVICFIKNHLWGSPTAHGDGGYDAQLDKAGILTLSTEYDEEEEEDYDDHYDEE